MPQDKDGNRLTQKDAIQAYLPHAFDYLVAKAKVYNGYCTYKDLGDHVQEVAGITFGGAGYRWVGKVLGPIVRRCKDEGLPPLTSLVVHAADHKVGERYRRELPRAGHTGATVGH